MNLIIMIILLFIIGLEIGYLIGAKLEARGWRKITKRYEELTEKLIAHCKELNAKLYGDTSKDEVDNDLSVEKEKVNTQKYV